MELSSRYFDSVWSVEPDNIFVELHNEQPGIGCLVKWIISQKNKLLRNAKSDMI
jgi:hypothetical protein